MTAIFLPMLGVGDEKGVEWILSDFPEEHVMEKKREAAFAANLI